MAGKGGDDDRSIHLITDHSNKFKTTADVVHYLYYEKRRLHPIQITNIQLVRVQDSGKQYQCITIGIRSRSERDILLVKMQDDQQIWINTQIHGENSMDMLRRKVMIISFGSNARAKRYHRDATRISTFRECCILSRWRGMAVINLKKHIEIDIPIEPFHDCPDHKMCDLNEMERPYVVTLQIMRENVRSITPTKNDEIRGYHINLQSMPHVQRFKTFIRPQEAPVIDSIDQNPVITVKHCRFPDGFCPKQQNVQHSPHGTCPQHHLKWLEPDICGGDESTEWIASHGDSKYVPAAMNCDGNGPEFTLQSGRLLDILQFCSVMRMEFSYKVCATTISM